MDRDELKKLIEEDDLGLLNLKASPSAAAGADERLITAFREINDFYRRHSREPAANKLDIKEMMLHSRLVSLRQDQSKIDILHEYDEFELFGESKPVQSIADIFSDDTLGILSDAEANIFTLTHVPVVAKDLHQAEYIAQRKPCLDFDKFEHFFKQCQKDLASETRVLMDFSRGTQINLGDFFVLKGMLVYVADEWEREDQPGSEPGRLNDRLRCIFENGTESDMLRRSLAARLYEEKGRRVSESALKLAQRINEITEEDQESGFIYVLRSLSNRPEIKQLKNLYKIGFSRGPVQERIKNAHTQPTYLMAPVNIVSVFQCYNMNPQKFETLLHHFFGSACLSVDVTDSEGRRCIPREWFVAPIDVNSSAVKLLIKGEIVDYRYNPETKNIEHR